MPMVAWVDTSPGPANRFCAICCANRSPFPRRCTWHKVFSFCLFFQIASFFLTDLPSPSVGLFRVPQAFRYKP